MAHAFRPRAANARRAEALMTWVRLYALARPKGKHLKRREADLFAACVAAGLVDPEWQEKR